MRLRKQRNKNRKENSTQVFIIGEKIRRLTTGMSSGSKSEGKLTILSNDGGNTTSSPTKFCFSCKFFRNSLDPYFFAPAFSEPTC